MDSITIVRGSEFQLSLLMPPEYSGEVLAGYGVYSQLRTTDGELIANLSPAWGNSSRQVITLRNSKTKRWPLVWAEFDICFKPPNGNPIYTTKLGVNIVEGATQV